MKIHKIKRDIMELENLLDSYSHGIDEEVVRDSIEALDGAFEEKINNVLLAAKNHEKEAQAYLDESKRLKELSDQSSKQAERLLEYVDYACKLMGKTKFNTSHFKVSYRKGSEVVEIDEEVLPESFWVPQDPKPMSKTDLKKLIKEGQEIEGVTLVRKPDSLQVK